MWAQPNYTDSGSKSFFCIQTHETVAKALVEDPNVFEYDSLYDDMVAQKRKADPRLQKKDTKVGVLSPGHPSLRIRLYSLSTTSQST